MLAQRRRDFPVPLAPPHRPIRCGSRKLIARWLCHVLPKGFVAVRHFGFLSPAAGRALRRVRFLLGRGPVQRPTRAPFTALCPCCHKPLLLLARLRPVRGPPLSRDLLPRLAA